MKTTSWLATLMEWLVNRTCLDYVTNLKLGSRKLPFSVGVLVPRSPQNSWLATTYSLSYGNWGNKTMSAMLDELIIANEGDTRFDKICSFITN